MSRVAQLNAQVDVDFEECFGAPCFPRCDYEWMLIEESLPGAQWRYGYDRDDGWPYPGVM